MGDAVIQRRTTLAFLCVLYFISYVDRLILGLLVQPLRTEFQVSDLAIGFLLGPAFAIFFTLAAPPIAWAIDRGNRTAWIVGAALFWSVMTIASGFAPNFETLVVLRVGLAISEAALGPAAISLLSDLFPEDSRPKAVAAYMATGVAGATGSFILGGAVLDGIAHLQSQGVWAEMDAWRAALVAVGGASLAAALALAAVVREPARRATVPGEAAAAAPAAQPPTLPYFLGLFVGVAALQMLALSLAAWYPTLLIRKYGLSAADAGYAFGLLGLTAGCAGTLLLPRGILAARRRFGSVTFLPLLMLAGAVSAPLCLAAFLAPDLWSSLFLLAPGALLLIGTAALPPTVIAMAARPEHRARLFALFALVANGLGFGVGPVLTGAISDWAPAGAGLSFALSVMAGIALLLALPALILAQSVRRRGVAQGW